MGPAVALAEAMETANKTYGTRMLMTASTRELAGDAIETREVDCIPLGPHGSPTPIYELLGIVGSTDAELLALRDRFAAALAAYRQERWSEAETGFQACLALKPQDGPSGYYLAQLSQHLCSS